VYPHYLNEQENIRSYCERNRMPLPRLICLLMVLNLGVVSWIAYRNIHSFRNGLSTEKKHRVPKNNIQLLFYYLPRKWQIWFIISTLVGLVIGVVISLHGTH
jgi:hypothetical protein